jgi:hypothetical protein
MKIKRRLVVLTATVALLLPSAAALASPSSPTEGGNGAGKSGQCTGNPDGRPASCHDQGGPGNQP